MSEIATAEERTTVELWSIRLPERPRPPNRSVHYCWLPWEFATWVLLTMASAHIGNFSYAVTKAFVQRITARLGRREEAEDIIRVACPDSVSWKAYQVRRHPEDPTRFELTAEFKAMTTRRLKILLDADVSVDDSD